MKKWIVLSACVVWLTAGTPVAAAGFADDIVAELQEQGYSRIETEVTWLGRVRIVAEKDNGWREIIVNPRTGEILRDLWLLADGSSGRNGIVGDGSGDGGDGGSSNSGSGSDDDSSDDDSSDDSGSDDSGSDDGSGSDDDSSGSDDD